MALYCSWLCGCSTQLIRVSSLLVALEASVSPSLFSLYPCILISPWHTLCHFLCRFLCHFLSHFPHHTGHSSACLSPCRECCGAHFEHCRPSSRALRRCVNELVGQHLEQPAAGAGHELLCWRVEVSDRGGSAVKSCGARSTSRLVTIAASQGVMV